MARYRGPKCRKCRRYGASICGSARCALTRRSYPPGPRPARRRKISDRGLQLMEKQKVRFAYGVMEKQFRRYYEHAVARPGPTGEELMRALEERLDNVVYRLGLGGTRSQARQLVTHGHVSVNGRKLDIPSARVHVGWAVGLTSRGSRTEYAKIAKEAIQNREVPSWLEVDREQLAGRVVSEPGPTDIDPMFNPSAIVEFYSR